MMCEQPNPDDHTRSGEHVLLDKGVALAIRDHQLEVNEWEYSELAKELHRWVGIFCEEFKLATPAYPVVGLKGIRNAYGTYQPDRGELGTRYHITINTNELSRGPAQVLATLCHELVHHWQAHIGKPSRSRYHNVEFRVRAAACGLLVDKRGCHSGYTRAFTELMERYGVNIDALHREQDAAEIRPYGASVRPIKMAKWSCRCTRVRCARDLEATCRKCHTPFELGEHVEKEGR